jgi:hypothetical protein
MKMTSGVRLNERRKRALVRLQESTYDKSRAARRDVDAPTNGLDAWTARREAEIVTLKKRTGQLFN